MDSPDLAVCLYYHVQLLAGSLLSVYVYRLYQLTVIQYTVLGKYIPEGYITSVLLIRGFYYEYWFGD